MKFNSIFDKICSTIVGLICLAGFILMTTDLYFENMILWGSASLLDIFRCLLFRKGNKNILLEIANSAVCSIYFFIAAFLYKNSESLRMVYAYISIPLIIFLVLSQIIIRIMEKRKGF